MGDKRMRVRRMLNSVTGNDDVEILFHKRRVLNSADVNVAAHCLSCYRSGNRIGFDAGNPPTEQLHDAQECAAAAAGFEKPATRFESRLTVLLTAARSGKYHRNWLSKGTW